MRALFLIGAAIVFAFWLFGMSQPPYNRPMIFWKPVGRYGILLFAILMAVLGLFL